MSAKSLKREYAHWLWSLLLVDALALAAFVIPGLLFGATLEEFAKSRLVATVVIPVVVLLLINVLNNEWKCLLVYWRPLGWLPGCEAFTKHAHEDPRVDVEQLRKHVGEFPTDPKQQNARWYALYKMVEDEAEVREPQRRFLMYRDMATLSLPFVGIAPSLLYLADATPLGQWLGAGVFAVQYVLTAISARHSGIRFVRTVLALHSARKVPPKKS
jgi:hypothetical protein